MDCRRCGYIAIFFSSLSRQPNPIFENKQALARPRLKRARSRDGAGLAEGGVSWVKWPRLESLKSRPFDGDAQILKNLTHLQPILLFKDSSGAPRAYALNQGF